MKTLFVHGTIYPLTEQGVRYSAMAVEKGKIAALGSDDEILALQDGNSRIIDLQGKTVLPGFNDSHMHLLGYAAFSENINLAGATSVEEICQRIERYREQNQIPKGQWIVGRGWNQDYFVRPEFPTKDQLDRVCPDHPVMMTRACGHAMVCNSKALELSGVTAKTPQVEGGLFEIGEDGTPNGVFREAAMELISSHIPAPTVEQLKRRILFAQQRLFESGITSVQTDDFGSAGSPKQYEKVLEAYRQLEQEGLLKLRVCEQCNLSQEKYLRDFLSKGYHLHRGGGRFRLGPLKILADGSLGARTALLRQPYADDPTTRGIAYYTPDELESYIALAHENGMQVIVHCIGDGMMEQTMDILERVTQRIPREDCRHGIVHCQITDLPLLRRFARQQLLAYIQPIFLHYDLHIVEQRVGKSLAATSYNWKTLVESGVHCSIGSDCPVESFAPLPNLYCAVTRQDLEGYPAQGFYPQQRLSVWEAFRCFTAEGAYATFEEKEKGLLLPGMAADLVMLSDDPFRCDRDPRQIKGISVEMTVCAGELVYQR